MPNKRKSSAKTVQAKSPKLQEQVGVAPARNSIKQKYSPFVWFRASPLQRYKVEPEFGLGGWLCEQYRLDTGLGEWKMFGMVVDPKGEQKYYEPQGMWSFVLNEEISFGRPQDPILEHFGLTRETLQVLLETAQGHHPLFFMYHFIPRKEWGSASAHSEVLYQRYLDQCIELHQENKAVISQAPEFGSVKKKAKSGHIENISNDLISLCREYSKSEREMQNIDLFDPEYDEVKAKLKVLSENIQQSMSEQGIFPVSTDAFVLKVTTWYGN